MSLRELAVGGLATSSFLRFYLKLIATLGRSWPKAATRSWPRNRQLRGGSGPRRHCMTYDSYSLESEPSSPLPEKLYSTTPVALDAPDARSPPTRSCAPSVGVECVEFVGLIWDFLPPYSPLKPNLAYILRMISEEIL